MKSFFIYELIKPIKEKKPSSFVVMFCPDQNLSSERVRNEVKEFFQTHMLPDDFVVLGGSYLEEELRAIFVSNVSSTFSNINQVHKPHFEESITLLVFDENGVVSPLKERVKRDTTFYHDLFIEGLRRIFVDKGGLVEANDSHHYVFPSGKHSPKFLRTGNILLFSSEIYFIALFILPKYDVTKHEYILCDTSSINSLAFALAELKSRFDSSIRIPTINSFKSYSIFEEEELAVGGKALFLVSSSTSGGIIERLKEKMDSIKESNIVLIFFLGEDSKFTRYEKNIVCNLNIEHSSAKIGLKIFPTEKAHDCLLCEEGSFPVVVRGDTFLTEKPRINKVLLSTGHVPQLLSKLIKEFKSGKSGKTINILKCNYKENDSPEEQYDIYFDIDSVVDSVLENQKRYPEFEKKLYKRINLSIPSNTKFIISLPDSGSEKLAQLIKNEFEKTHKTPPEIIKQKDVVNKVSKDDIGTAVIVCSSMVNGGNLLYLSRVLRDFEELSIIYFIGVIRTNNVEYHNFLKNNLSQGAMFGTNTSPFVHVDCIYLPDEYRNTSWLVEKVFLEKLLNFIEENPEHSEAYLFFKQRFDALVGVDRKNKGLANRLFYPNIFNNNVELKLNKNFAFLDFEIYGENSQADIYFIISVILNDLRFKKVNGSTLRQYEYERNILEPGNFLRYNDGIIQACLLRAAKSKELAFDLDENSSSQMKDILIDMISNPDKVISEALMEFAYAIVINKLRLKAEHKKIIIDKLSKMDNKFMQVLCEFSTLPTKTDSFPKILKN